MSGATIDVKFGDVLEFAVDILAPTRPPAGWTGWQMRSSIRAAGADGQPTGDVLGAFTATWPDLDADVVLLESPVINFAGASHLVFDVLLLDPAGKAVTTTDNGIIRVLDRITPLSGSTVVTGS